MVKRSREVLQHGVELHGKSFRYRLRVKETVGVDAGGQPIIKWRTLDTKRYPFFEGDKAASLDIDSPLTRENALANANMAAINGSKEKNTPQWIGGARDIKGTLLEWLIRYQVESLEHRAYRASELPLILQHINARIDKKGRGKVPIPEGMSNIKPRIQIQPRASAEHDIGQIRSIIRIARTEPDIYTMLHKEISIVGSDDIERLLSLWSGGNAKPATKRRLINTLSSAWKHHHRYYGSKLPRPWEGFYVVGDGEESSVRALTPKEIEKINAQLKRLHPTVRTAIQFLAATGARRNEVAKLCWENMKWPTDSNALPSVHFERTKAARGSYKSRFTYIDDELLVPLALMVKPDLFESGKVQSKDLTWQSIAWPKTGWMFPSPKNPSNRLSGDTIYQAFRRSVDHAGVPKAGPHHLRHTKATQLISKVPQAVAQELLGHDDAASFAIYRHLAEEAGYMARDKTGALVSAAELTSKNAIVDAMKKLTKEQRTEILMAALAD